MTISIGRFGQTTRTQLAQGKSAAMWKDLRLWVGLALIAFSVIVANVYISGLSQRTTALVAAHNLVSGTVLEADDLEAVQVALPQRMAAVAQLNDVIGRTISSDLSAGQLLFENSVVELMTDNLRVISLPIKAGHLPQLHHGAAVEIWMTPSLEGVEVPGPPQLIVEQAVVLHAPADFDTTMDTAVTLQVLDEDVPYLVKAMRDGAIDVVGTNLEMSQR